LGGCRSSGSPLGLGKGFGPIGVLGVANRKKKEIGESCGNGMTVKLTKMKNTGTDMS